MAGNGQLRKLERWLRAVLAPRLASDSAVKKDAALITELVDALRPDEAQLFVESARRLGRHRVRAGEASNTQLAPMADYRR